MKNSINNSVIPEKNKTKTIEIISTILLSIASLGVAWCSYQSTLWNGKQVFKLAESNLYYRHARDKLSALGQQQEIDAAVTINFLEAVLDKRQNRIDYYKRRARPELAAVLSAWLSTDPLYNDQAPAHPLIMEEYKMLAASAQAAADSANQKADFLWKEAEYNNKISDHYILYTVIFSMVMFLGALATKLTHPKVTFAGILFAGAIFLISVILLFFSMPIAKLLWQ
jgi:hypothetical protein